MFEAAIDRFGWAVTAAWVGEVGQDVTASAFQGSGYRPQLWDTAGIVGVEGINDGC